jgi:4-amino-4-deoxy-L-arabinose transferase-like glycosyltransferase
MNINNLSINVAIVVLAALLFVPFLGNVHLFDWDEINFAECAREMIVTGNYSQVTINFQPFWEKPPLFFWMQAFAMKLFGINEFSARFPNAICGIVTLLLLFNIGSRLYDNKFGMLWVLAYAGSFLPHFYFKSGIIDPWFNLFILTGIYFFTEYNYLRSRNKENINHLIFSGILFGLAIMTKGPVALLIFGLCFMVYSLTYKFRRFISIKDILVFSVFIIVTGSIWFIIELLRGRADIIVEFFEYQVRLFQTQDAGHGGPFYYHFIVLLIGCFPASIPAIMGFFKARDFNSEGKHFKSWMIVLFWVVLILFSIVRTKIVHYSSLAYFPLTFLAAYNVYMITQKNAEWKKWQSYLIGFIGLIIASALIAAPLIGMYTSEILEMEIIRDPFAVANLQANVKWHEGHLLIGIFYFSAIVISLILYGRKKTYRASIILFISTLVTVNLTALIFVPKIERYSQGAAIDFYKSIKDRDVYVETYGFKSYAHLFYTNKKPLDNPLAYDKEWLLHGPSDKTFFIVSKNTKDTEIKENYPQLKEVYRKNGFVFYITSPQPSSQGEGALRTSLLSNHLTQSTN